MLTIAFRIVALITIVLGLAMLGHMLPTASTAGIHMTFALLTIILLFIVVRPRGRARGAALAAEASAVLALILGAGFLFHVIATTQAVVGIHALLGICAIALIEMARGMRRRDLAGKRA